MRILFIAQDGFAPSGVTTYGLHVLQSAPGSQMLLLNATGRSQVMPPELLRRIAPVTEEESHDPARVALRIEAIASAMGKVTIAPNTGDTPWAATLAWLRHLSPERRAQVRILGIVHSDMETQFSMARQYVAVSPVWGAVSRHCADTLRVRLAGTGAVVHEITYPTLLPRSISRVRKSGPLRLVYAGRLEEPQKRVSRLVELFTILAQRGTEFRAVVAGDGPARRAFASALAGSPAAQFVSLAGAVDRERLGQILAQSDVLVLTSAFEGMPLALLEGMAAALCPVVMAVQSGLPELLRDGVNARVVPQGDVEAMAGVLQELASDRSQNERLGLAARETIRSTCAPEAHFKRLSEIIDELWSMPPPNPDLVPPDPTAASIRDLARRLRRMGKPAVVFGAGMFGRKVVDACLAEGVTLRGLFDSDPSRQGWSYRGLQCRDPKELPLAGDVVVAIGSLQFAAQMREQVVETFRRTGADVSGIVAVLP